MGEESLSGQTALFPPADPEQSSPPATVWVVASNYADDPHPHIEGVFADEDDADALLDSCADTFEPPHPVAWGKHEIPVQ